MLAKIGAAKLVPPAAVTNLLLLSRNPFVQLPETPTEVSLEQKRYGAFTGEESREISGTRRKLPEGIPGTPVCQDGREVRTLTPPPPEESLAVLPTTALSFQVCSGI